MLVLFVSHLLCETNLQILSHRAHSTTQTQNKCCDFGHRASKGWIPEISANLCLLAIPTILANPPRCPWTFFSPPSRKHRGQRIRQVLERTAGGWGLSFASEAYSGTQGQSPAQPSRRGGSAPSIARFHPSPLLGFSLVLWLQTRIP